MSAASSGGQRGERPLDLPAFLNAFSHSRQGYDLTSIGPSSEEVFTRIANEGVTRSLIASHFWRAFVASPAFRTTLKRLGNIDDAAPATRTIVVPRPELERFDLLVLEPRISSKEKPRFLDVNIDIFSEEDVRAGVAVLEQEGLSPMIGTHSQALVEEFLYSKQPATVVLAPAPDGEKISVPSLPLLIQTAADTSTAGVVVECNQNHGSFGVTAALHGIGSAVTVNVDGIAGNIKRTDSVTDSAFISLPNKPVIVTLHHNGVMSGVAPRGQQGASFVGFNSQARSTTITGWDPQIPSPSSNRQALIYTGRDSQPGDSGAALITNDNWIVGFAFERSKPGQNPAQSSWIWAESVLNALDIRLA